MSRAFVKEDDAGPREELPELPRSAHPNYITIAGLRRLRERLAQLRGRADADPRELRRLEARVAGAVPIEVHPRAQVAFGATVTLALPDGSTPRYRIVGEDEAAPERGCISWISPLARALQGARVGDVVAWRRPAGDLEVEVVGIDYADS